MHVQPKMECSLRPDRESKLCCRSFPPGFVGEGRSTSLAFALEQADISVQVQVQVQVQVNKLEWS